MTKLAPSGSRDADTYPAPPPSSPLTSVFIHIFCPILGILEVQNCASQSPL